MLDVVVFAALAWERAAVQPALRDVVPGPAARTWRGRLADGRRCALLQTGVGLARAAAAAVGAPEAGAFVSIGCAGALVADLRCGDVVVATAVLRLDEAGSVLDSLPAAAPPALGASADAAARPGVVASSPVVLAAAAAKAAAARSGALVVEMEAAAIAAVARARGIACSTVRVVLDEAADAVPALPGVLDDATGEIRPLGALRTLASRPWAWPAVARVARQRRVAAARLRAIAARAF